MKFQNSGIIAATAAAAKPSQYHATPETMSIMMNIARKMIALPRSLETMTIRPKMSAQCSASFKIEPNLFSVCCSLYTVICFARSTINMTLTISDG